MVKVKEPKINVQDKNLSELKRMYNQKKILFQIARKRFEFEEAQMILDDMDIIEKQYLKLKQKNEQRGDNVVDFFDVALPDDDNMIVIY